jgi:transposase
LVVPSNIEIIYLPPYSPELNPVEKLWQHMKSHIIKNKIYDNIDDLEEAVCSFIKGFDAELIKKTCSTNHLTTISFSLSELIISINSVRLLSFPLIDPILIFLKTALLERYKSFSEKSEVYVYTA